MRDTARKTARTIRLDELEISVCEGTHPLRIITDAATNKFDARAGTTFCVIAAHPTQLSSFSVKPTGFRLASFHTLLGRLGLPGEELTLDAEQLARRTLTMVCKPFLIGSGARGGRAMFGRYWIDLHTDEEGQNFVRSEVSDNLAELRRSAEKLLGGYYKYVELFEWIGPGDDDGRLLEVFER